MRESPHPRVELEVAAVRATRRPVPQAIDDLLRRVDEAQARLAQYAPGSASAGPTQESLLGEAPAPRPSAAPAAPHRPVAPAPSRPRVTEPPTPAYRASSVPASPASPQPAAPGSAQPGSSPGSPHAGPPASPHSAGPSSSQPARPAPSESPAPEGDLAIAWQRVVDEIMRKKPMVGAVLAQARPLGVTGGELTVAVAGNHFQRDMLADRANRDMVLAAAQRSFRGVERINITEAGGALGGVESHPVVLAALAELEGEVVAVRPRPPEGEGQ